MASRRRRRRPCVSTVSRHFDLMLAGVRDVWSQRLVGFMMIPFFRDHVFAFPQMSLIWSDARFSDSSGPFRWSSGLIRGRFRWDGPATGRPETSSSCSSPSLFPASSKAALGELWNVNILSDVLVHVPKEAHSQREYLIGAFYISTFQLAVKSISGPTTGDSMETVPSLLLSYYVTSGQEKPRLRCGFFLARPVLELLGRHSCCVAAPWRCRLRPRGRGASSIKLGVIRAGLLQLPRRVGINVKQN